MARRRCGCSRRGEYVEDVFVVAETGRGREGSDRRCDESVTEFSTVALPTSSFARLALSLECVMKEKTQSRRKGEKCARTLAFLAEFQARDLLKDSVFDPASARRKAESNTFFSAPGCR